MHPKFRITFVFEDDNPLETLVEQIAAIKQMVREDMYERSLLIIGDIEVEEVHE